MDVVRFADAPFYSAPDHDDVLARRLQGGEASSADFALVGHSTLIAGAVIPMDAAVIGKIYVVTDGVIVVEQEDGALHELRVGDSIFVPAGEARAVLNLTDTPAAMIVVTPSPSL
ncbi:cupin domain-containing protein (plasmid) [Polymorphobacter sp. PAMC 29334]|uniref:cupin domain-containing protein n=1 Tax=Polymorphobacter sp. PAMC 29334 TaxID=2862331 RepID=UPI001C683602|nr:cupin domain-containing protein [Polymorphobacter sp. PAMC 29334]QYE37110.1 cupin domain-containing protein [Polymorphobacter sp. PAMC 29334]